MRGQSPKVQAMAGVPLFSRCGRSDLAKIAQLADEIDFQPGKVLTREGAPGREFFVILEGNADVRQKSKALAPMRAGDFFGEIALLTDAPRTATVTAVTPIRALVITDRAFKELLRAHPRIQTKVLAALGDRLAPESI